MGRLRITYTVTYDIDPKDYGVTTMAEAAAEELNSLYVDLIGTLAAVGDEDSIESYKVEIV